MSQSLEDLIRELPLDKQVEVRDFVEFLHARQARKAPASLRQDWAGALKQFRDQYSSVELQHLALGWRDE